MNTLSNDNNPNPDNLQASDFTEAEHAAVDAMAAPLIEERKQLARTELRYLSQNRSVNKRMNRPEKASRMSYGANFHLKLIDKGLAVNAIRNTTSVSQ